MVEVVRTNFAPIFSDYENFLAHWCTNRSATKRQFSNLFFSPLERVFASRKKMLQTASKSAYKHRRYLLLNNANTSLATVMRSSIIYEKAKNITLRPLTPTCAVRFPPNFAR